MGFETGAGLSHRQSRPGSQEMRAKSSSEVGWQERVATTKEAAVSNLTETGPTPTLAESKVGNGCDGGFPGIACSHLGSGLVSWTNCCCIGDLLLPLLSRTNSHELSLQH